MSFYDLYRKYNDLDFEAYWSSLDALEVERALSKNNLDIRDFLTLLSPKATNYLEQMARRANQITVQNFGRVIQLYTPLYLSNYCVNHCSYCSFNAQNKIRRSTLELDEVEQEAKAIARTGLQHLLLLTGESRYHAPLKYLKECTIILRKYFSSLGIEIYPLDQEEYRQLIAIGVDSLTIYQETYLQEIYRKVHLKGPKTDYQYRLEAPERGCAAGFRSVNIGALLGLGPDWRKDAFFTGLHASYLQDTYWDVELAVSFPRMRPHVGHFAGECAVADTNLVQNILALRLFLPRVGITISTRESAVMRDNLLPLGITKMSAGSSTEVGGRFVEQKGDGQFDIDDERSVSEIRQVLLAKGYQPVFKDWHPLGKGII